MKAKKIIGKVVLAVLAVLVLACIVFCGIYFTRFQSIASLEKYTDYEDGYNLYSMDIKYDYSLDDIINSGYTDMQGLVDAIIDESLPLLPVSINVPSFGCRNCLQNGLSDRTVYLP